MVVSFFSERNFEVRVTLFKFAVVLHDSAVFCFPVANNFCFNVLKFSEETVTFASHVVKLLFELFSTVVLTIHLFLHVVALFFEVSDLCIVISIILESVV